MNSSVPPVRKIASNLLWTPEGLVHNPLVSVASDGRIVRVEMCPEPDRLPSTEFYAGVLVPDFPADYRAAFETLRACPEVPLGRLLARCVPAADGVLAVISGLDYPSLTLTSRSQIRKL